MISPKLTLKLIALLCTTQVFAQTEVHKLRNLDHPNLKYSHALTIHETSSGSHWVGTYAGLIKVSPHGAEDVDFSDKNLGLPHSSIHCIANAGPGQLWLGTGNGIALFDHKKEEIIRIYGAGQGSFVEIKDILDNGKDDVWVATGKGLKILSKINGNIRSVDLPGLNNVLINALHMRGNDLWVGTEAYGVFAYDIELKSLKNITTDLSALGKGAPTINGFLSLDGQLFASTWNHGILEYDQQLNTFEVVQHKELAHMNVRHMLPKSDHEIWVASMYDGLNYFDLHKKQLTSIPLQSESVWFIHTDSRNNLWIGTMGKGISIYDQVAHTFPHYIPTYADYGTKNQSDINSITANDNDIWLGTIGRGVYKWNKKSQQTTAYLVDQGRSSYVKTSLLARDQTIWIGTDDGLYYTSKSHDELIKVAQPQAIFDYRHLQINGLGQDSQGSIWAATYSDGIYAVQSDLKGGYTFHPSNIMALEAQVNDRNLYLHIDANDRKWIIRENSIQVLLPSGQLQKLPNMGAHTILSGPNASIWAITYADGLFKYDEEDRVFEPQTINNKLPNHLTALQFDEQGKMWVHSYDGIFVVDEKQNVVTYTTDEGLQSNFTQFNAHDQLNNGHLVFGGENGINIVDPSLEVKQSQVPRLDIASIGLLNDSVDLDQLPLVDQNPLLNIDHAGKLIDIEFQVLDYAHPDKYAISYQLIGFDQAPRSTLKGERRATYTNLDPGEYRLNYWLGEQHQEDALHATLIVKINPPYWMTWWFRMLVIIVLVIAVWLVYRTRIKMAERDFKLQQIAQEKELGQLRNEKLTSELKHRSEELNMSTMNVIKRNNTIDQITVGISELMNKMQSDHDRGRIKHFLKRMDDFKQDELTWDEFVRDFDASHNDFVSRFQEQFSEMNQKELKLCAYLRMGLSNRDIASLMGVSIRSIETSRYRIRKKVGTDINGTLSEFILRF